jgi:L-rhamnose mutarotase
MREHCLQFEQMCLSDLRVQSDNQDLTESEILDMIKKCNIENYSIFHKDGMLYAYYEYTGNDYKADMAKMAADPKTREWWAIMEPMQDPVSTRKQGEWWATMEEVFHLD